MRGERGREHVGESAPDAGKRPEPEAGRHEGRGAEARAEASDRRAHEEADGAIREAKERVADVLWQGPAAFVERASASEARPHLARFFEAFASLDDRALPTEALKRARDAAKGAAKEEGAV